MSDHRAKYTAKLAFGLMTSLILVLIIAQRIKLHADLGGTIFGVGGLLLIAVAIYRYVFSEPLDPGEEAQDFGPRENSRDLVFVRDFDEFRPNGVFGTQTITPDFNLDQSAPK